MTYSQVWWPIPGIHALHLIHPKCTHTAVNTHKPWTHTRSSGQPFSGSSWGFSALLKGTSVVVLKAERVLYIHSPHLQFLPDRDLNSQVVRWRVRLSNLSRSCWCALTGHQMSLYVEHMACCLCHVLSCLLSVLSHLVTQSLFQLLPLCLKHSEITQNKIKQFYYENHGLFL